MERKFTGAAVLYDPFKRRQVILNDINKERNHAHPGSLLKVWDGTVELTSESKYSSKIYST